MAPILGYWDIRGYAEPIRYLLHYLGIEFVDKRYQYGPGPKYESDWTAEKYNLGLELPNSPYYIDGDLKLSQSLAIIKYVARHNGLYYPEGLGNDVNSFNMVEGHVLDIQTSLVNFCYNEKYEEVEVRESYSVGLLSKLKDLSLYLGEKSWLMGDHISHIDFILFETLEVSKIVFPNSLEGFDNLKKLLDRFVAFPGIQKYRETSKKWPLCSPFASFGGKGEPPKQ